MLDFNSLIGIMINAFFNGLGSGLGLGIGGYFALNIIIKKFETFKNNRNGGENKNEIKKD